MTTSNVVDRCDSIASSAASTSKTKGLIESMPVVERVAPQHADGDGMSRQTSLSTAVHVDHLEKDAGIDFNRFSNKSTYWNPAVTPFAAIVAHHYEGHGTEKSPFLVTWIGDEDAENPLNYPQRSKWLLTAFVSLATLCVSLASSAYAGAASSIRRELGGSTTMITLGISLYVLGFALGPLAWAPISEVVGRRNSFLVSFALFAVCNAAACASPSLAVLLVFRFLAGAIGSSPLTNAGGSIADVFKAKDRGLAMAFFASFPLAGPALGPIMGGFLGEAAGFRWVMALLSIYAALVAMMGVFLHTETYAPLLLRRRAQKLCKTTGKHYISKLDLGKNVTFLNEVKVALTRPWLLLICEPIVLLLSLYSAIVYSILYSFFASFPIVFEEVRGWSPGQGGLAFLGILTGMLIGIVLQVTYVNPKYKALVDQHGGITAPPEGRLPQAMWAAVLLVVGLAGFAITDAPSVHWIVPIIFSVPFGAAMVMSFIATQSYLIDSYIIYAASVLAANSVVRSLLGAAFPLFTPYMYHPGGARGHCPVESCGIHVGPAIAAVLALIFLPAPFYFYKHGARIRRTCKYSAQANEILEAMLQKEPLVEDAIREDVETGQANSRAPSVLMHGTIVAPVYMPAVDEEGEAQDLALQRTDTLARFATQRSVGQDHLERVSSIF